MFRLSVGVPGVKHQRESCHNVLGLMRDTHVHVYACVYFFMYKVSVSIFKTKAERDDLHERGALSNSPTSFTSVTYR